MKYILDFDRTLFDTDAFKAQVAKDNKTDSLLTPAIWQQYSARDFLYNDVRAWLQKKPLESVVILTALSPEAGPLASEFQKAKLASSGMCDLVSEVIFMVGDKGKYVQDIAAGQPACFVDDLLSHHQSVQKYAPYVTSLYMDRAGTVVAQKLVDSNIHLVRNLAEVDAIMGAI
jgi:hypothetical protein